MAITEVFPNPTVKHVIFQIRYPNLFFLESKIGDIQLTIMEKFPHSQLLIRRHFFIGELDASHKTEEVAKESNVDAVKKIWQFTSDDGVTLNILQDSLDINSTTHKTYNNPSEALKFRDIIKFVLDAFLRQTQLQIISRIGLRYIDECPVPNKTNEIFQQYYNTSFPISRFPIENASEMRFVATVKRGNNFIRFI